MEKREFNSHYIKIPTSKPIEGNKFYPEIAEKKTHGGPT